MKNFHFYSCSIDHYIFGNFETSDGGDSLSAKFRAFKFPESNYVLFTGTVNVCLKECKGVSWIHLFEPIILHDLHDQIEYKSCNLTV